MATVSETLLADPASDPLNAEDLAERFGPIPLARVCWQPLPGTATEDDWIAASERQDHLCELVDGTLVEKTMGWYESVLAMWLGRVLGNYVEERQLGVVLGPDGPVRFRRSLIRMPDVAFVSRQQLPRKKERLPRWLDLAPELAVEVISQGNTRQEMERKLDEYFSAGVRLVWYVYPQRREVHVYTARDRSVVLTEKDLLDGGDVLPGFSVALSGLFAERLEEPRHQE
jgi:Uma2 family endonuclease